MLKSMAIKRHNVQVGQRFRVATATVFGGPGAEWEILGVAVGIDGVENATLAKTADPTERKTVSVNALLDRHLYTPVAIE